MSEETKPPKAPLALRKRVERVLVSQGRAPAMYDAIPKATQDALAKLCSESGELAPNTREEAKKLIDAYYDGLKAVVEDK